jgi:hypothetical protein
MKLIRTTTLFVFFGISNLAVAKTQSKKAASAPAGYVPTQTARQRCRGKDPALSGRALRDCIETMQKDNWHPVRAKAPQA